MGDNVTDGFRALDEMLKVDPLVHDQARRIRTAVEDAVKAAGLMGTALLQGSYGRKTMRPPLKDVDLVMVLPASLAHLRTTRGMSQWAFDGFRRAIEEAGVLPGVRFDVHEEAAHALQLTFPGVDFTVDLVPAFETQESGQGWLYIADREQDQWTERSDVRRLRDRVAARNQSCGGIWVNQVRQAKHSLDCDGDVKRLVCGLLVESLAYEALTTRLTPQEALLRIFMAGAQKLTGAYVGLAQEDLTAKWSSSDRAQVVQFFQQNQRLAAEAMRLEGAGDAIAAMGVWREVLGDLFPVPEVSFAERLRTVSLVGGGITASGRLTTASGNVRPGRPWRAVDPELGDHVLSTSFRCSGAPVSTMDALLNTPAEVAALVAAGQVIWGAADVVGRKMCGGAAAILELDLLPLPEAAAEGHPTERVRIVVTRGRDVLVYPLGCPGRPWRHRNALHPKMLCLQFPGDDPALLWLWPDGLEPLLARVRMHLMCEEVYRRDGVWPGEELPHGRPENGAVWPVSNDALRRAMRRWAR